MGARRRVAVIGSGIAGSTAATNAANSDPLAEVTVITEDRHPTYTPCAFASYIAAQIKREALFVPVSRQPGINYLYNTTVTGIDTGQRKLTTGDSVLEYDSLIIASGSVPLVPDVAGLSLNGVFRLKTLDDADEIRGSAGTKVVVVGAGPSGIEAAWGLHASGRRVTLVEQSASVLPGVLDRELGERVKEILLGLGIAVLTGERLVEIKGRARVEAVETSSQSVACESVILTLGYRPSVRLAREAGLAIGPSGGIVADERMGTSHDGVYACGDCVETRDRLTSRRELSMLWANARRQGEVAGVCAAGGDDSYEGHLDLVATSLDGKPVVAAGNALDGEQLQLRSGKSGESLWRVGSKDGRIMMFQAINVSRGTSALLMAMMNGVGEDDLRKLALSSERVQHVPWYRPLRWLFANRSVIV